MLIRDLFAADVTRDIPPVVYFHEQSPARLASEVGEYIITGGHPDDPRPRRRLPGIHEELVALLRNIAGELQKPGGPSLPAAWVSGFYGSGKSSFAKLLGLALDGVALPDGRSLEEALLARDTSPRAGELRDAWKALRAALPSPLAVVFDIGSRAREGEHVHEVVVRAVQERLQYCPRSEVALFELALERDGRYEAFLEAARATLQRPWEEARREALAHHHFSRVLHALDPETYTDPMSWVDVHGADAANQRLSVDDACAAIRDMLAARAATRTLVLVVDEVSQYIHGSDERMLRLQSFVADLGARFHGRVWLLVTGQEKLDDARGNPVLGKLKDRFPQRLRVHLESSNIRDVVHQRLLRKSDAGTHVLRDLFRQHRAELVVNAYGCQDLSEEDFLEVYPLLSAHVDLLLNITSSLRRRTNLAQGDDYAIRGLLQLLGELFRRQNLATEPVGRLVTLDAICEVQQGALDPDARDVLARIQAHPLMKEHPLALRAARAVALLELLQDDDPANATTATLVARCLYGTLGEGSLERPVGEVLERLRAAGLLGYSEKQGYRLQSALGQEWESDREAIAVTAEQISKLVHEALGLLLGEVERPRLRGASFPLLGLYSDGRQMADERLGEQRQDTVVTVDFRMAFQADDRDARKWLGRSSESAYVHRLVWVAGDGRVKDLARELRRSQVMIERYDRVRESLSLPRQRLLIDEKTRREALEVEFKRAVAEVFRGGAFYFRGASYKPGDFGDGFASALHAVAERKVLPDLYPHFTAHAISEKDLEVLLRRPLPALPAVFLEDDKGAGLGIFRLDAGQYEPACAGRIPQMVLEYIDGRATGVRGTSGGALLKAFAQPPYGLAGGVVKACVVGLLRAGKVQVKPEDAPAVTSVADAGALEALTKDRAFRLASVVPSEATNEPTPKDRVRICKLFKDALGVELDRENEPIADAVFQHFPVCQERLRRVGERLAMLPGAPRPPATLDALRAALEACRASRQVVPTVTAVRNHLDALRDGLALLATYHGELTDDAVAAVREAAVVRDVHAAQLEALEGRGVTGEDGERLRAAFAAERPWREVGALGDVLARLRERYAAARHDVLQEQGRAVEQARARLRAGGGFERLSPEAVHRVMRPLAEALPTSSAADTEPALVALKGGFEVRLHAAEERAHDVLDEENERAQALATAAAPTTAPVPEGGRALPEAPQLAVAPITAPTPTTVKVVLDLRNRVIADRYELDALLKEIGRQIAPHLERGARVRIT